MAENKSPVDVMSYLAPDNGSVFDHLTEVLTLPRLLPTSHCWQPLGHVYLVWEESPMGGGRGVMLGYRAGGRLSSRNLRAIRKPTINIPWASAAHSAMCSCFTLL
jgi:hypothetical protein